MALQNVLKTCSDPINRQILDLLREQSMNAGEIARHFSISAAAVSQHLSALKTAGLVRCERSGKFLVYELNASVLEEAASWIQSLLNTAPAEQMDSNSVPSESSAAKI